MIDYTEHFFFYCKKVRCLWQNVENIIRIKTNLNVKLDEKHILLGFPKNRQEKKMTLQHIDFINQVIAIGKLTISKLKYGKSRNILEIFETECILRKINSI